MALPTDPSPDAFLAPRERSLADTAILPRLEVEDAERRGPALLPVERGLPIATPGELMQVGAVELESIAPGTRGLSGTTDTASVQELVSFLAHHRKTGTFEIGDDDSVFAFHFESGGITSAHRTRPAPEDDLAEAIAEAGAVRSEYVDDFVAIHRTPRGLRRDALEDLDLVDAIALVDLLAARVQRSFQRVLELGLPYFRFRCTERPASKDEHVRLNPMQMLIESTRARDERSDERARPRSGRAPQA